MQKLRDIYLYTDDLEIIDYLRKIPVDKDSFNGKQILKYLEEDLLGQDLATVLYSKDNPNIVVLCKFDKTKHKGSDAGLLMTISGKKHIKSQIELYTVFKSEKDKSEHIYQQIIDRLRVIFAHELFNT